VLRSNEKNEVGILETIGTMTDEETIAVVVILGTGEAVDSRGTIVEMITEATTETVETGTVQSVKIQTLPSVKNATDVENHAALEAVHTVANDETTVVMTAMVADLNETTAEMTTVVTTETVEETGIVQSVKIQTLPSVKNATDVKHHVLVDEVVEAEAITTNEIHGDETTDDSTATSAEATITVDQEAKSTTTTIGNVHSVKIQTSHSVKNATDVKHHVPVDEVAQVETNHEEDLSEETTEDVRVMEAITVHLEETIQVGDLHDVTIQVEDLHDMMIQVEDLHDETIEEARATTIETVALHKEHLLVQDHLAETDETVKKSAADTSVQTILAVDLTNEETVAMTARLSRISVNLENLENPVEKVLGMLIIDHRSHSTTQITTIEGKLWVLNITTSMLLKHTTMGTVILRILRLKRRLRSTLNTSMHGNSVQKQFYLQREKNQPWLKQPNL
jgi:hypothetical protein